MILRREHKRLVQGKPHNNTHTSPKLLIAEILCKKSMCVPHKPKAQCQKSGPRLLFYARVSQGFCWCLQFAMISSGEVWVAVYPASGAQTPFISRPQAPSIKPFQTNPQPTRHQGAIPPSAPSKSTILRFWKNNLNHLPWVCFVVLIHTLLHFWNNSLLNAQKLFLTTKKKILPADLSKVHFAPLSRRQYPGLQVSPMPQVQDPKLIGSRMAQD